MKRFIDVHRGEVMAGQGEVILKSDTDTACLVIAAYDEVKKIGCLAHAMFLSGELEKNTDSPVVVDALRNIDSTIDEMVKDMTLLGADKADIKVRLVAGENVPHRKNDPDYNSSIASAIEILKQKHVQCDDQVATDAGEFHVVLDMDTGTISYT